MSEKMQTEFFYLSGQEIKLDEPKICYGSVFYTQLFKCINSEAYFSFPSIIEGYEEIEDETMSDYEKLDFTKSCIEDLLNELYSFGIKITEIRGSLENVKGDFICSDISY
jgi:hypothetical protein